MRSHKDTELNNKSELYKTLQEEIRKVIEEKAKLSAMLEKAGETKGTLESKVINTVHVHVHVPGAPDEYMYMYNVHVYSVLMYFKNLSLKIAGIAYCTCT